MSDNSRASAVNILVLAALLSLVAVILLIDIRTRVHDALLGPPATHSEADMSWVVCHATSTKGGIACQRHYFSRSFACEMRASRWRSIQFVCRPDCRYSPEQERALGRDDLVPGLTHDAVDPNVWHRACDGRQ